MLPLIAVSGALAQKAGQGGLTWVFLQYLLGFRRLGWDVLFLDRLEPEMCVDAGGHPCSFEDSWNLRYFLRTMERFGLEGAFTLLYNGRERCIGVPVEECLQRVRRAACLINVMGYLSDEEMAAQAPRHVFLDIDPGFDQMWQELGYTRMLDGYHDYVTVGRNIGQPGCPIPTCGRTWIPTPQPVVLSHWPVQPPGGEWITSVGAWRGPYAPVEFNGETYGLRVHEFRKFARLPRLTGERLQVALDIDSADWRDIQLLESGGWSLVDPQSVARDPDAYRQYVQGSRAEFMVAKGMYVQSNSGWFSDRSICYLASGKPVLAQDTGITDLYPTGEGLLTFRTLEEAAACIEELRADYARHARAARAIAEEYFDSDRVLPNLLERLGIR